MGLTVNGHPAERIILLDSAARAGDQVEELLNPGWLRLVLWCNVTVNPGAAETIGLVLSTRVPTVGGAIVPVASSGAPGDLGGVAGTLSLALGPGVTSAWATNLAGFAGDVLPQFLRFVVDVSAAGLWTYTLGVDVQWP